MLFQKLNRLPQIDLPREIQGKQGIIAVPSEVLGIKDSPFGYILCVQDVYLNIKDISKIKDLQLVVKTGVVNTPYGLLMYLLFAFYDKNRSDDVFTYEYLINPSDMLSYHDYTMLGMHTEWLVLAIHDKKVYSSTVFDNIYNIGESLKKARLLAEKNPCVDFRSAKTYYFTSYDLETLMEQ